MKNKNYDEDFIKKMAELKEKYSYENFRIEKNYYDDSGRIVSEDKATFGVATTYSKDGRVTKMEKFIPIKHVQKK